MSRNLSTARRNLGENDRKAWKERGLWGGGEKEASEGGERTGGRRGPIRRV